MCKNSALRRKIAIAIGRKHSEAGTDLDARENVWVRNNQDYTAPVFESHFLWERWADDADAAIDEIADTMLREDA